VLGIGLGFDAMTGELMEYIVTRDQLAALDRVPKHPPKPPYETDAPPLIPKRPTKE